MTCYPVWQVLARKSNPDPLVGEWCWEHSVAEGSVFQRRSEGHFVAEEVGREFVKVGRHQTFDGLFELSMEQRVLSLARRAQTYVSGMKWDYLPGQGRTL